MKRLILLILLLPTAAFAQTAIRDSILSSGADGMHRNDHTFWNSAGLLFYGNASPDYYDLFLTFTNVTVPAGATIDSAFIELYSEVTISDAGTYGGMNAIIRLHQSDNPSPPANNADFDSLTVSSAFTDWAIGATTINTWEISPNFGSTLQALIDEAYWDSGDNVTVVLLYEIGKTDSDDRWRVNEYDDSAALAAKLRVYYSEGGAYRGSVIITGGN